MHKTVQKNKKYKGRSLLLRRIFFILQVVALFLIYVVILLIIRDRVPDPSLLVNKIEKIYDIYGYDLIFLGALLEGTFVVGFYVPGSLVVLLGAMLARSGTVFFPYVILFGTAGLVQGYMINYVLGRFGWYRILSGLGMAKNLQSAKKDIVRYQNKALFFGYMMPSTGSLLSTASGILKIPFETFIIKSILIQIFWSLVTGSLAYIFGMQFINLFLNYFGFIFFAGLFLYFLKKKPWKHYLRK